jgi:hypothetical protein
MVIGVFLMLLGALGLIAGLQWIGGRWLGAAHRIARNSSVHILYATPVAGLLVASLGLSILWPPAIVLVFLAAAGFMVALLASPQKRPSEVAARSEPERHAFRSAREVPAPFSSRTEIARRTDRPGTERRPQPRRARQRPTGTHRDARRAG